MKTFRRFCSTILFASVVTLSTQALAEANVAYGRDGRPQTIVSVRDLDLGNASDVRALYGRVQQAAAAVCDFEKRSARRAHRAIPAGWHERCVLSAVDAAVRDVGSPQLSAVHREAPELIARGK